MKWHLFNKHGRPKVQRFVSARFALLLLTATLDAASATAVCLSVVGLGLAAVGLRLAAITLSPVRLGLFAAGLGFAAVSGAQVGSRGIRMIPHQDKLAHVGFPN